MIVVPCSVATLIVGRLVQLQLTAFFGVAVAKDFPYGRVARNDFSIQRHS
jgi:hypothetical protein